MATRLRFRCEKCSAEFRPVYHYEGDVCPLEAMQGGGQGQPQEATDQQGEKTNGDGGEGAESSKGETLDEDGLTEHMKKTAAERTPEPQPSESAIEDLIVKIARREAGAMDGAVIEAVGEAFGTVVTAVDERFNGVMAQVEEIARNAATEGGGIFTVKVERPDMPDVTVEGQHRMFAVLLKLVAARRNTYLVGPAGSGKTMAAEKIAEALSLGFYPKSMGPTTTAYELLGYMDAGGNYVPGLLFEPFTNGGLLLLDEIDSASAAAVTTLNTALANEYCAFPHGVFKKHAEFRVIASGNTFGRGADRMYVGRTQLDAATLNRFFTIEWDYDEGFEKALAAGLAEALDCNGVNDWCKYVQNVRKSIIKSGIRAVAGTRDITEGAYALAAGFTMPEVANMRFFAAMSKDDRAKVEAGIK